MSARVILGIEFDVFQAALFRKMWFCPYYLDDSGVSTGKSERLFACAVLRAILLENPYPMKARVVAIYYWSLSTTEEVILPRFDHYLEHSEIFRMQFLPGHGGKFRRELKGGYQYTLRNGNKIVLPAGDFWRDSKSQASKRFNDLFIDESKEIDARSDGINKMLLDRATAPTFNQNHPVWANHVCLMGHAEDRFTHPGFRRNRAAQRQILDGSQKHVIMSSNYRDYTGEFIKKYRPDERIRQAKLELGKSAFEQQWLGLWSSGTANWYSSVSRTACLVQDAVPELGRTDDGESLVLGWDTAPGMTAKADLNSGTVMGVKQVDADYVARAGARVLRVEDPERGDTFWRVRVIYALPLFGLSADQLSGTIHALHRVFGFSLVVMDPSGGGDWVYKKMRDKRQLISNVWQQTNGLCTLEDQHLWPEAEPVVVRFGRSSSVLDAVWDVRERTGDDGPVDRSHRELRKAFDSRAIIWPQLLEERTPAELERMTPEQQAANKALDDFWSQLGEIKVAVDNKTKLPKPSRRGFYTFMSGTKKDGAYSVLYAYMGVYALICGGWAEGLGAEDDVCVVSG